LSHIEKHQEGKSASGFDFFAFDMTYKGEQDDRKNQEIGRNNHQNKAEMLRKTKAYNKQLCYPEDDYRSQN
jgi:hypothetical protein